MKKLLMIAYYYPPVAGGGVQRTSKFVKYLPEFGWAPHVLTVKSGYDYYADASLENDVRQDVLIFRSHSFEPMKWVRQIVKKMTERRSVQKGNRVLHQGKVKKYRWLLLLKESIFIPDGEIGWLPFAVWRGWRIIRNCHIDLIYSTSSPYTDHLVACCLKKLTGKRWVADFRDPWSLHFKAPQFRWRKFMDRTLEKWVLRNADKVITVTDTIRDEFQRIHPGGDYSVITNGYDEDDFSAANGHRQAAPKFNITYTGILYKERSPRVFLQALAELLGEHPELKNELLIRFIGQLDNPGEADNFTFLATLKLDSVIELIAYVSHAASIDYALVADVLLLIVDQTRQSRGIMTGKLFEYLRSGKPILALAPTDGEAAALIRETQSGIVVRQDSVEEVKRQLWMLYQRYKDGTLSHLFERQHIERFSRRRLTEMLALECERCLNPTAKPGA